MNIYIIKKNAEICGANKFLAINTLIHLRPFKK